VIDVERVRERLLEIERNKEKLVHYLSIPEREFWADERNIATVKYLFLLSLEAMASVCNHLVSRLLKRPASSYSECFHNLKDFAVFEEEALASFVRLARMRNVLVHQYREIDDREICDFLRQNVEIFAASVQGIRQVVESQIGSSKELD